jgi:hypothetical protein
MTDEKLERIERELEEIKQRNARVEANKAWEVSTARICVICAMTYLVAATFLYLIGTERFWLNALTPVFGFYLSARSLPIIKKWWINSHYQNGKKQ